MAVLKKVFLKPVSISAIVLMLLCVPASQAWSQTLDKKKQAAISAIINILLLDGEAPTSKKIGFDEYSESTYVLNEDFTIEFDGRSETVELCFVINSSSQVNPGDITLNIGSQTLNVNAGENCFVFSQAQQQSINTLTLKLNNGITAVSLSGIGLDSASPYLAQLPSLTRSLWNEKAVRKTLKIFAFGGNPTDSQIRQWASMPAKVAIQEMLNFSQHNLKLAPFAPGEQYREILNLPGTFESFLNFVSSDTSNLPTPIGGDNRRKYGINGYLMEQSFSSFATVRGLNPFRQRIGFWETNYHLAVNLDAQVERDQMVAYYDLIMQAHEQGLPYKDVMGAAAKSAAVAMQYGHRFNSWNADQQRCLCNDDFAREIHQLFYGIFGANDLNHENGTIRETAKMLTGMEVRYVDGEGFPNVVTFRTNNHHIPALTILGQTVVGGNASQKIDSLMPISMQHPESLHNLPIMIIETLADDKLSEAKKTLLRQSWASLGVNRKLLDYIHAYAISNLFHSASHFKNLTSFERAIYKANKFNIENIESYNGYYWGNLGFRAPRVYKDDNAGETFRPLHNVFGGQTSIEASDSAVAFEKNYNRSAPKQAWELRSYLRINCDTCNAGGQWQKDWSKVIPEQSNGYPAEYVAKWLWNHVVGSLDKYSTLERAHLLSILATDGIRDTQAWDSFQFFDLNNLLCIREDRIANGRANNNLSDLLDSNDWDDFCRRGSGYSTIETNAFNQVLTGQMIESTSHINSLVNQLGNKQIELKSSNNVIKLRANERIHAALGFIFSTPFVFAEGE